MHPAQALFFVNSSGDPGAGFQRPRAKVLHDPVLLVRVQDPDIAQFSGVRKLSAPFGEERSLVQDDLPVLTGLNTLQNCCRKLEQVTVDVI